MIPLGDDCEIFKPESLDREHSLYSSPSSSISRAEYQVETAFLHIGCG
jgi:hypothetical protein